MEKRTVKMKLTSIIAISLILCMSYTAIGQTTGLGNLAEDYENGVITLDEKLNFEAMMLTNPDALPARYSIDKPLKDGTLLAMDISQNRILLDQSFFDHYPEILTRVNKQRFFDSPGGYFRIHYDTSGTHAVYQPDVDLNPADGVPDFVNRTAEYFDLAWESICDSLGYDTPPYDGSQGGGQDLYDVYMHRYAGAYGVTFTESSSSQRPGRNYDYTSYIYVDPTYSGFGYNDRTLPMKVTSAHEFFHAVQFAYNVNAGGWFMENCSTWMEDVIWDDINDNYAYIRYFLNNVHLPIHTANGSFEYGAFLWPTYIYQNWGHDFIRSVWETCITTNAMNALETNFEYGGSFIEEQYFEYSIWNFLTTYRNDGNHYEEGSSYPTARIMRTHSDYPIENQTSALDPTALGCNYILMNSNGYDGDLHIVFDGNDDDVWYTQIIKATANNSHTYDVIPLDETNDGEYTVIDFGQYLWVALVTDIVAGSTGDYRYSAYLETTEIIGDADQLPSDFSLGGNYPNPFNGRTIITLNSPAEDNVELSIFDVTGRKLTSGSFDVVPGVNNIPVDFGEISRGRLASGVYYYKIIAGTRSLGGDMLYLK